MISQQKGVLCLSSAMRKTTLIGLNLLILLLENTSPLFLLCCSRSRHSRVIICDCVSSLTQRIVIILLVCIFIRSLMMMGMGCQNGSDWDYHGSTTATLLPRILSHSIVHEGLILAPMISSAKAILNRCRESVQILIQKDTGRLMILLDLLLLCMMILFRIFVDSVCR